MSTLNTDNILKTNIVKKVVKKGKKVKRAKKDVVKQNMSQEEVLGNLKLATNIPSINVPREEIVINMPRENPVINVPKQEIMSGESIKPQVKKATKKVKRLVQRVSNEDPRLKMCRDELLRLYTELERFNNSMNLYRLLHNQPAFRNQINIECFKDDGQINPVYREQLKPKDSISKFYVIALEKVDIILIGYIDKSYVDNSDGTILYEHDCNDSTFKEYFRIIVEHVQKQNVKACTLDNGKLSYFIINATIQEITSAIYQLQRHLGETIVDKNNLVEKMLLPPNDFGN